MLKNKNEGITLIALVVTMVILLILAGVTINVILYKESLIKGTKDFSDQLQNNQNQGGQELNELEQQLRDVMNKVNVDYIQLNKKNIELEIGKETTLTATVLPIDVMVNTVSWSSSEDDKDNDEKIVSYVPNGNTITVTGLKEGTATVIATSQEETNISKTCTITITEASLKGVLVPNETKYVEYTDATGTAPVPGGYCVVKGENNTVEKGLVISDVANDNMDNDAGGNQFVWVPVPDVNTMYEMQNGQKVGKLYDFSSTGVTQKTYPTTQNSGYREPDVVTNASSGANSASGSSYDANSTCLAQAGITTDLTGDGNINAYDLKKQLQDEFDAMIASVSEYGGFYIGRFETQGFASTTSTDANTIQTTIKTVPTVQKNKDVSASINWYFMYSESKNIVKNSNVTSSMIWGCQWDRTLIWIAETNKKANGTPNYELLTNSKSWGNYSDSTGSAATNSGSLQKSGINEAWKKNNIYDLAGNCYERTILATGRVGRSFGRGLLQ